MVTIKRKVIQIADSTQLVSLPRKWSLRNNIKKGDELEIVDKGINLLIESDGGDSLELKGITIDLDGIERYMKYILHALYHKGYSEVKFTYNKDKTAQTLQQILHEEMIGFEVVEQTLNSSTIRVVAGALSSEFDVILKRAFMLVVSMYDGILEVIKTGNILPIKSLIYMEANNRKYSSFCKRMINKRLINGENITYLYLIVIRVEQLAVCQKHLCYEMMKLPQEIKEIDHELLDLFKETGEMMKSLYDVYYNYELNKLLPLFEKKSEIINKGQLFLRRHEGHQIRLVHYIFNLSKHMFDLMRAKMQLEI